MTAPSRPPLEAVAALRRRIRVARGEETPDLVLKHGRVVCLFSGELLEADVALCDGVIAGVGRYDGPRTRDARNLLIAPGFIEGHIHLESTLLAPPALAAAVLPHGTTTMIADPHELANVLGVGGIRYLLAASAGLPVDFLFQLPACVPATPLETSGARLTAADLLPFRREPRVLGLAEMMNYPGVLAGDGEALEKLAAFADRPRDGHAPLVTGRDLSAYVAAGPASDHECTSLAEAREKLRLGMHILIRQGTQAKNLPALLPLVTARTLPNCSLVTDDLHPHDILRRGHLDAVMNQAVAGGLDPLAALAMTTLNPARHYRLHDRGAVAPGYRADLVLLSSLNPIRVEAVYKDGRLVSEGGEVLAPPGEGRRIDCPATMHVRPYGREAFALPAGDGQVRVIELIPDQILTGQTLLAPTCRDGRIVADPQRDLLKVAVIERHQASGRIAVGLVRGFGLRKGALASSVAHDAHNILGVGAGDADLEAATRAVEALGGGLAVAVGGRVVADLPLPIGGLLTDRPLAETAGRWEALRAAARDLGCVLAEPFMHLSFLALPVIPALKISDRGLVDVARFEIVPLAAGEPPPAPPRD